MPAAHSNNGRLVRRSADPGRAFDENRARVYRWSCAMGCGHEEALDVVQDVFVRLVRAGDAAPSTRTLVSWLRRATSSVVIDRWRSESSRRKREAADAKAPAEAAGPCDWSERERVRGAVGELSEQQRLVLTCKVVDGMTFAAIAEELGLAAPTVKTHYLRALESLRDQLEPHSTTGAAR